MNLQQLDAHLTLWVNAMGTPWLDPIVMALTHATTWIPLYILLIFVLFRTQGLRKTLAIVLGVILCILIADQTASGLCKPLFQRLRPTHEPSLEGAIRIVNNYRSSQYGFFSSHAANTCAMATYLSLILRRHWITALLVTYAAISCWTRLYLGVHYVGDITVGILYGSLVGWCLYKLNLHTRLPFSNKNQTL